MKSARNCGWHCTFHHLSLLSRGKKSITYDYRFKCRVERQLFPNLPSIQIHFIANKKKVEAEIGQWIQTTHLRAPNSWPGISTKIGKHFTFAKKTGLRCVCMCPVC